MKHNEGFDKIEGLILKVLSKHFSGVNILEVRVEEAVDMDDDDILRVEVIFEGSVRDLPPSSLAGAIRHVRPVLSEQDVSTFPMMSFISAADAKIAVGA